MNPNNALANIKLKEFEFIPKFHQQEFEQHIIDLYCKDFASQYNGLPHITDHILRGTNPKFLVSGACEMYADVPDLYQSETKGMTPEEENYWAARQFYYFQQNIGDAEIMYKTEGDIWGILMHYNMSFFETKPILRPNGRFTMPFNKEEAVHTIRNMPFTQIW